MRQTEPSADRSRTVDIALARSVLYGAMARAFHPPNVSTMEALASSDAHGTLREAAHLLDSARVQALPLRAAVEQLARSSDGVRLEDLLRDYARLFGHTARGLVCPYETEYGSDALFQQPQALADIAGYYRAFGLRTSSLGDERVDHIGCECEFMAFLSLKEAYGMEAFGGAHSADRRATDETLDETRKASRRFLRDHLGRFGRAFAGALISDDAAGFFGRTGNVLCRLLELDCERLGLPLGPLALQLRSTEEEALPMGCGGGPELIQIQRGRT